MGSILPATLKSSCSLPQTDAISPKALGGGTKEASPVLSVDLYLLDSLWVQSTWVSLKPSLGPLATVLPHQLVTCQHSQPLGQLQGAPPAPEVGPYPAAPLHPFPFVLKGRGNGPGINSTQGILAMPSYPRERATRLFSIYSKIVCILL